MRRYMFHQYLKIQSQKFKINSDLVNQCLFLGNEETAVLIWILCSNSFQWKYIYYNILHHLEAAASSRLTTKVLVSKNLSTQFTKQFSVFESSLFPGLSGTHLSQHWSVKLCTRDWNLAFSPSICNILLSSGSSGSPCIFSFFVSKCHVFKCIYKDQMNYFQKTNSNEISILIRRSRLTHVPAQSMLVFPQVAQLQFSEWRQLRKVDQIYLLSRVVYFENEVTVKWLLLN
jgi:hypothetical protein